eukprot:g15005.t1
MEQAAEAAAAAAGGVFSAGALFPLEVIKTNLQAHTKQKKTSASSSSLSSEEEEQEEQAEGNRTTPSGEDRASGGSEEEQEERQRLLSARGNQEQALEEAPPSVASVSKDIFSREGVAGFYRGVWYASGQSGVEKAAYFYGYSWLKALALRGGGGRGELSTTADLGLGYLAEAFHLPFTIPIEVVLTKIMTSKEKTNAFAVIQGILSESGPAGFYSGIQAYAVLCLKPAIQYAVFNRLKAITLAYRGDKGGWAAPKELTAVQAFVIGAISRAVATVIVFPYIRAKVLIMSRKTGEGGGGGPAASTSILSSLVTILKDDGVSALFQGIAPEISRGVLSAALMLMVKEKIHSAVKGAIIGRRAIVAATVNDLESVNKAQKIRLEQLSKQAPDVEVSTTKHICETSAVENLSAKSPEKQLAAMADAIVTIGQNVNSFYKDVKYREAVQQATDTAQDELMHMELDRLNREVDVKFTRQDALDMRKMIAVEVRTMRKEMEQEFAAKLSKVYDEVLGQLSQVTDSVRVIQETTNTTNELLKYRIEEAFTDIQSASESMEAKIRKITDVFGLSADPEANDAPSFPELLQNITDLQKLGATCRDDLDVQTEITSQLSRKMEEMQESVEEQVGTLAETFKSEFGDGMAKMVSDLEISMGQLEEKMEGEVAEQLGDCSRKLEEMAEQVQETSTSTVAAETVQVTLMEQAKAQEKTLQSHQEELKESLEKGFDHRLSGISGEIALLGTRVDDTAVRAEASFDKISAVGHKLNTLYGQVADLQRKTASDMPSMENKLNNEMKAVRDTADGLAGELAGLLAVVQKNRSELDSHVKSSKAFIRMAADQQEDWSKTSKTLVDEVEVYKADTADRMTSLERSNVSVVTSMRRLQKSFDALATKEGRWDRLEVQTKRHVQVLGGHLAEMEGAATCAEPFSLSPAMQKHLSAVAQMVAKIMATRADYEVTRQAVNRKNPAEDTDWDRKVDALRLRYVNKFVSDVVNVASKLRPLPDRPVEEVREIFANKLELSMKLAISKYKPIQAGATILGKVHLLPSCMACDRPFIDNPGPGDTRAVVQDARGERERSRERSLERSSGSPATGCGGRSPGQWTKGGGGGSSGGSPVPAFTSPSSFAVEDDGGSVASMTSLASKESQVSSSTASRYRSRNRDRSPHKYVMRSGFKMRQSASEGGGLVAHQRGGLGFGHEGELAMDESLEDGLGGGGRLVVGNANSASMSSLATSPGGRAGLEGIDEGECGDGQRKGRGGRRSAEGGPRDQINGAVLDLRPSTVSAQRPVEDIELDDGLDDHELSDSEQQQLEENMAYRNQSSGGHGSVKRMGEVANAISSCLALSFFSISMILANKYLAASFEAKLHLLPMAFQCFVAVILVEGSRIKGWVQYEPFNMATAMRWFPIAIFFCTMLLSSFLSMQYMNVPMVTVFKSLTNLIIVTGDFFWHKQVATPLVLLSLGVMTGGAILASWSDIEFSAWGYFWMSANCFATASYVLTMKFATRTMKLPKFGMVFYNNLLGFLIMLPVAVCFGEVFTFESSGIVGFLDRSDLHTAKYMFINLFAGAAGFFLNFAALWCVGATSATTYAVVNTVNNFPVSILGYFLFPGSTITKTQAQFILVNILGGFIYSAAKIKEQKAKERENALRASQNGDVEAVPLVAGTSQDELKSRSSPGARRN